VTIFDSTKNEEMEYKIVMSGGVRRNHRKISTTSRRGALLNKKSATPQWSSLPAEAEMEILKLATMHDIAEAKLERNEK